SCLARGKGGTGAVRRPWMRGGRTGMDAGPRDGVGVRGRSVEGRCRSVVDLDPDGVRRGDAVGSAWIEETGLHLDDAYGRGDGQGGVEREVAGGREEERD